MGKLPGLTYTIHHSTDRLRRQQEYVEDEILMTRKLLMGHQQYGITSQHGIVSPDDPGRHLAGSSDPLAVSVNSNNQFTVDVNPGMAVMKSGVWIQLHNTVRQVSLANPAVSIPNVVYFRYATDSAPVEPNDFQDPVVPYTMRVGDPLDSGTVVSTESLLIGIATVEQYQQWADSILEDIVPLAIATIQSVTVSGVVVNQLVIDHTDDSYAFNRPWFSPVDLQHRSMIGTGTFSPTNPHNTSANDLTVGDLSMFQIHLDHGIVVSKDRSIAKVPGYRCTSAITTVLVDDAAGTATGYGSASYVELPYFPVRVGRAWVTATNVTLAALHVPQTHRVVFPVTAPPLGQTVSIYYARADAVEPPLPGVVTFRTQGPGEQELVVTGGSGYSSLGSTEEAFSDADRFPMRYEMYLGKEAELMKTPQVVYCYKRLEDIGIGAADPTDIITPYGPGRLMVGIIGADHVPALDIGIRVVGTDPDGNNINELFTFTQANWSPVTVPSLHVASSNSVHFSTAVFATIETLTVETRVSDGPNTAVMIWMAQTPYSNYDLMADSLHIATVDWDGRNLATVYDKRIVVPTVRDELSSSSRSTALETLYTILAGGNQTVYLEDFRCPRYHSLETEDELNELAVQYPTYQMSKQHVGLHGYYRTAGLPVSAASGTDWRVSLLGLDLVVDPWFTAAAPSLLALEAGVWTPYLMVPVVGIPGTWEVNTAVTPTGIQVQLYPGQCYGMAVYG